jgi:hypothetical protein
MGDRSAESHCRRRRAAHWVEGTEVDTSVGNVWGRMILRQATEGVIFGREGLLGQKNGGCHPHPESREGTQVGNGRG